MEWSRVERSSPLWMPASVASDRGSRSVRFCGWPWRGVAGTSTDAVEEMRIGSTHADDASCRPAGASSSSAHVAGSAPGDPHWFRLLSPPLGAGVQRHPILHLHCVLRPGCGRACVHLVCVRVFLDWMCTYIVMPLIFAPVNGCFAKLGLDSEFDALPPYQRTDIAMYCKARMHVWYLCAAPAAQTRKWAAIVECELRVRPPVRPRKGWGGCVGRGRVQSVSRHAGPLALLHLLARVDCEPRQPELQTHSR